MVGNALMTAMQREGYKIIGTSRRETSDHTYLDVTWDLEKWPDLPECDSLIICSSLNKLKHCQNDRAFSYAVNVDGLEKAIKKYKSSQTKIIFFSSSHVFSGQTPLRREDEMTNPQNVLGEHKVIGEQMVLSHGGLVVRMTKIIDSKFLRFKDWANNLKNLKPVDAFSNLMTSLVTLDSLVKVMDVAVREDWSGIIHVSGPDERSYSDIALMLARGLGCDEGLVHYVEEEKEVIGRTYAHTTLQISERVKGINIELPDVETVVSQWCRDFIRSE
jgi:dTDP-4-dehydrorhamnose reductase